MAHREKDFDEIVAKARTMLQKVFQTKNDVLILTTSGTGGMEAAISNLFS